MKQDQANPSTRKKFLLWTAATLSSIAAFKLIGSKPTEKKKDTVRMLTQDGKLVEIDSDIIIRSARKITDKELQAFVKK
ncbi:hypothetical protein BH11BAC4_BH11BAC4_22860 [soil metagenome]